MERLCSTIFLLLVEAGALISNTELNVQLEPKSITVCEGDSVTLNCTFQPGGKHKVKLYYSQTNLDCNSATDTTHEKRLIRTEHNDTWSTFTIPSIKTNDSGWFFCKVTTDIPILIRKCSDGIQVVVYANKTPESLNRTENQPPTQSPNPSTEDVPTTCMTIDSKSILEYQTSNSITEDLPTTTLIHNTSQVEELIVQLEPKSITVCEGDPVTLNCTFQPGGKYKVKLYYSQTNLDCNSATDGICEKLHISTGNNATWSTLNFPSIKTNDSGWYFCKVTTEIPILIENCSDGIQVLVTSTCRIMACL